MSMEETLILAFTIVVGVSTVFYTIITGWLTWETRKMRQAQTEPRVSIQVEPDRDGLPGYVLVIRNEGQGPAKNVRFEFTGDPSYFRNSFAGNAPPTVDQLPAIKDGLDYMEAGCTLRFTLGTVSPQEFDRAAQDPWRFVVKYKNLAGKTRKSSYVVDFSQFRGQFFIRNHMKEISDHLNAIRKDLHSLAGRGAKVQVVTQTIEEVQDTQALSRQKPHDQMANDPEIHIADNHEKY